MYHPRLGKIIPENITSELGLDLKEIWDNNFIFCRWLEHLDLHVYSARVFRSLPNLEYKLHIDVDPSVTDSYAAKPVDPKTYVYDGVIKLNFVYSSRGTTMTWYRLNEGKQARVTVNASGYTSYNFDKEDCEILYHTACDSHCLVNGGIIHTLTNAENDDNPRMCYSLSIQNSNRDLTWDSAVAALTPWLDV
jgi:hypothetical protein